MLPFLYHVASDISPGNLPTPKADTSAIQTTLQIVFGIAGALALLMIVVSGLRYIISSGNPDRISKAKDGIIFALVGLLIAITAEAIVSFVVIRL
jgi:FtsH-binding integral membrane protein